MQPWIVFPRSQICIGGGNVSVETVPSAHVKVPSSTSLTIAALCLIDIFGGITISFISLYPCLKIASLFKNDNTKLPYQPTYLGTLQQGGRSTRRNSHRPKTGYCSHFFWIQNSHILAYRSLWTQHWQISPIQTRRMPPWLMTFASHVTIADSSLSKLGEGTDYQRK